MNIRLAIVVILTASVPTALLAQGKATIAREIANYVMRKFGKEATEIGSEVLTQKIEALAVRHGDEAFVAIKKVGPRTLRIAEEAGENGSITVRLLAKHGDEVVWVVENKDRLVLVVKYGDDAAVSMMKHMAIAVPLLTTYGQEAAGALKSVNDQNGRRISMMEAGGLFGKTKRSPQMLHVIGTFGDTAADFVWDHREALSDERVLPAFLDDPEPYLTGTKELTLPVVETAATASIESPSKNASWIPIGVGGVGCLLLLMLILRKAGFKMPTNRNGNEIKASE